MKRQANSIMKFGSYYAKVVDGKLHVFDSRGNAENEDFTESVITRDDVVRAIAVMEFVGSAGITSIPAFTQTQRIGTVSVTLSYPAAVGSDAARILLLDSEDYVEKVTGDSAFIGCTQVTLAQARKVLRLLS